MAAKTFLNTDILLIGKTGHGKSATGNSILGRKVFESVGRMDSVTNRVDFEVGKVDNRVIMVVDVPGVCDTKNEDAGLTSMLEYAVAAHSRGYHALLLVYKYSDRYTQEEEKTVALLKEKLGSDFIKNHAIVVLTNGDTFEKEGNSKDGYEAWCRKQNGPFRELLEECNFRTVLFNNHTKDVKILTTQRDALLDIIDTKLQGKRYDQKLFKLAQNIEQEEEKSRPMVTGEMLNTCSLILQDVEDMMNKPEHERRSGDMTQLLKETKSLQKIAVERDKKSGELNEFIEMTKKMELVIAEGDGKKKEVDKKSKTAPSKTPLKFSTLKQLVTNVQPSKFAPILLGELRATYQQLKNTYTMNVTQKIALKLHQGSKESTA